MDADSSGQLVALMGPSGSGKTTLLNVLARRAGHKNTTGDSYVNNSPVDNSTFNQLASYVEQEDALIGSLTVWETLQFAADLALPRSVTKSQRKQRIQMLLNAFGIQNQTKTLIGTPIRKGISGGQKRRVSVASQLMTCPRILFLDEPTSGLDSTASYEVIAYVRELAKANNVCSSHCVKKEIELTITAHHHCEYPSTIYQHLSALRHPATPIRRKNMLFRPDKGDRALLCQYRQSIGYVYQSSRVPARSRQFRFWRTFGYRWQPCREDQGCLGEESRVK